MTVHGDIDSQLMRDERLERGYVLILPGIEGRSLFNRSIRRGLLRASVHCGIEIYDWTRGPLRLVWNIRNRQRHQEQARVIAEKIVRYRERYPEQPVYLVGHSGGGGMIAYALAELPEDVRVTGGILIVPALSPTFDLTAALRQTQRGLWNFSSYGDIFLLGAGTTLVGTLDGRHSPSAGMLGFQRRPTEQHNVAAEAELPPLIEVPYRFRMARQFNFGGHLSCVNPWFVHKWIAPIVMGRDATR